MKSTSFETVSDTPGRGEPAPLLAAPVAQAVAADLESIFPEGASGGGKRNLNLGAFGRRRARDKVPSAWEKRLTMGGALAAAACLGVSAGALMPHHGRPQASASGPPQQIALATPAPLSPAPAAGAVLQPAPAPPVSVGGAADAAEPAEKSKASGGKSERRASAPARRRSKATAAGTYRRAYARAERAGVSRKVLAQYDRRYLRLKKQEARDPKLVAASYRRMASDLSQLAAGRRIEPPPAPPPRQFRPWRTIRTHLAAIFR